MSRRGQQDARASGEATAHYVQAYEAFAGAVSARDPLWLRSLRATAISCFADAGFPTTRLEDWKYSNPSAIVKQRFELDLEDGASSPGLPESLGLDGALLTLVNGHFAPELSRLEGGEGLVTPLAELRHTGPDRLQERLGRIQLYKDQPFAALNTAFLDDGATLFIPRGQKLEAPVHIVFQAEAGDRPRMQHPRNLLVAEPESRATVVIDHVGGGDASLLTNAVSEIFVGANAELDLVIIQREDAGVHHVSSLWAELDRDARLRCHTLSLGGAWIRNDVRLGLCGTGAECVLNGLLIGAGARHVDNHSEIDHAVPRCRSRQLYKGVLGDESRGVFRGRVVVRPDAQKSDAEQSNPNLLLSRGARVDTRPQLEIYADDVKCAHGSTVGQLDAEALFYLRSRGLSEATATELLTQGFANEILTELPLPALADALRPRVLDELRAASRGDAA